MDISQVDMEGLIRDIGEEEATRLLKKIMENNVMLLNLQKQILKLQVVEDQKRRRQEREQRRREYEKRWEEEEQRRQKRKKRRKKEKG